MYCLIMTIDRREWRKNKKWHRRKDLPSLEYKNGFKFWHKHGLRYIFTEYENGTKEYYDTQNRLHKEDGPAVFYSNGDEEWWHWGIRHRANGPAVIYGNKQYWFMNGRFKKCIV